MKKAAVILAALLWCLPAQADTITITLTTATGLCVTPSVCTATFSDAQTPVPNTIETSIIAVYQQGCNASISGVCTTAQVLTFWATQLKNDFVNTVNTYNQNAAAQAAAAAVAPISLH
jgi:hypothetical protein